MLEIPSLATNNFKLFSVGDILLDPTRESVLSLIYAPFYAFVGGAVASWLMRSSPGRAVWVRVLAGDIVLCSWVRHFTLTVPLSTQVYKWVPANLMLGVTLR